MKTPEARAARRRKQAGCVTSTLAILLILLLIVGGVWSFLVRPSLHNTVQTQLDHAMSVGVQQIPAAIALLPAQTLPVRDDTINNLIVLNLAPNDPIKNPATQITPNGIRISLKVYGFDCAVAMKPALQNGHLVATNVAVDGPIGLIMSPEELAPLLNQHFADAQSRLKHPIQNVLLKDHEMDLTLGPAQ